MELHKATILLDDVNNRSFQFVLLWQFVGMWKLMFHACQCQILLMDNSKLVRSNLFYGHDDKIFFCSMQARSFKDRHRNIEL